MDALDDECSSGSCTAGRGRANPSEIPRWNVDLHDQSGRTWSSLALVDVNTMVLTARKCLLCWREDPQMIGSHSFTPRCLLFFSLVPAGLALRHVLRTLTVPSDRFVKTALGGGISSDGIGFQPGRSRPAQVRSPDHPPGCVGTACVIRRESNIFGSRKRRHANDRLGV
jgi:hypothetical protein